MSRRPLFSFSVRKFLMALALIAATGFVTGCASTVVGIGATVGVAALEERPMRIVAQDMAISAKIRLALVNAGEKYVTSVGVEVYEGRVLLTGAVETEEMRAEAVRMAWKVINVEDVLNELEIGDNSLRDWARDSWITAQIVSKMTFDKEVLAINYSIETVNKVVYLLGLAQDQAELDRVISHARAIDYVRRIINHVRVKKAAT